MERKGELAAFVEDIYFADGMRWRNGRLWFSDVFGGSVYSADASGAVRREVSVDGRTHSLGWLANGDLLVVHMDRRRILRRTPRGEITVHADLSGVAGGPINGMVLDAVGRAYVGTFGFDLEAEIVARGREAVEADHPDTGIICVEPDGSARMLGGGLSVVCNAPVLAEDGRILIVGEMYGRRLTAFDVGADGTLTQSRTWASLAPRTLDGFCTDREGAVWFSHPYGREVVRVAEGGKVLEVVKTALPPWGCAIGGDAGELLFVSVAPSASPADAGLAKNGKILSMLL